MHFAIPVFVPANCAHIATFAPESALSNSINGSDFNHSFSYAVSRGSNSNNITKHTVSSTWNLAGNVSDAMIEWEPSTGRIEMKIPLSALGISDIGADTWLDTAITIGGVSTDSDIFEIHYRLTGAQQPWIYGDFE